MGSIKDKVAIVGMGCSKFGERWDMGAEDLAIEAAYEAYEDAGISKDDIEGCWFSQVMAPLIGVSGTVAADYLKLGNIPVISLFLMGSGVAWALININSLPMVVDMVEDARIGTYTGLYYLFSTMAAILGPNFNGLIIQAAGNNYNSIMLVAPTFMLLAFLMMIGVKRGEAKAVPV